MFLVVFFNKILAIYSKAFVQYKNNEYIIKDGIYSKDYVAYGIFDDTIESTGWSVLKISTNPKFDDEIQAYSAGLLESYLTHTRIYQSYLNCIGKTDFNPKISF